MNLSFRQKRFCEEYIIDLNGAQAVIRAGYSKSGANVQAARLLANVNVRQYILLLQSKRSERTNITSDYVLNTIVETIERCKIGNPVFDQFGKQIQIRNEDGTRTPFFKPESANVIKGCELLGKHLKLFTDKIDVGGQSDNPLVSRIERIIVDPIK